MRRRRSISIAALSLFALVLICSAGWAEGNKATIVVEKKAKSDGEITFSVTPSGGEAIEVGVTVKKKMTPAEIVRDAVKELSVALGEAFVVKPSGSKKVVVKTADKQGSFDVVISGQSVTGLSVVIK